MAIFTGQSYEPLNVAGLLSPVYAERIDENFSITETALNIINDRMNLMAAAGQVDAADAGLNIPNMLMNGNFALTWCSPFYENSGANQTVTPSENIFGQKLVKWADGWWYEEDSVDALDVQSLQLSQVTVFPQWKDPQDGIAVFRGAGSGVHTGVIYQRADIFNDLQNLRNKVVGFVVEYTAQTDNEFYLEISDGVNTTNNLGYPNGPSPAVTHGVSRHQFTVDALATKLSFRIVIQTEAPVNPALALRIHQCYARIGVGNIAVPTYIPPFQTARDLLYAEMLTKFVEFGTWNGQPFIVGGSFDALGTTETFTQLIVLPTPLVWVDDINYFTSAPNYMAPDSGDPRDINQLSTPPDAPIISIRRPLINRVSGDTIVKHGRAEAIQIIIKRTPLDPVITPATGFYITFLGLCGTFIPPP